MHWAHLESAGSGDGSYNSGHLPAGQVSHWEGTRESPEAQKMVSVLFLVVVTQTSAE